MNGIYVILFVFFVTVYFLFRFFLSKKISSSDEEKITSWNKSGKQLKWVSILLCAISTFLLKNEIITSSKLKGAQLAQADFGIFWVFSVFVIPSIFLVFFSLFLHFKFTLKKIPTSLKEIADSFLICSILVVLLPLYFFWWR